ncbi:MAG: hypothetical protein ABIA93_06775 [Candidatus Woesearchaeota archaeon]
MRFLRAAFCIGALALGGCATTNPQLIARRSTPFGDTRVEQFQDGAVKVTAAHGDTLEWVYNENPGSAVYDWNDRMLIHNRDGRFWFYTPEKGIETLRTRGTALYNSGMAMLLGEEYLKLVRNSPKK